MKRRSISCRARGAVICLTCVLFSGACRQESGKAASPPRNAAPPAYEGYHDITNCGAILAWAWDRNAPDEPIRIDIYDGNLLIATALADQFRQDLLKVGIGNGKHGLQYPTPVQLQDGQPHYVLMKFAGTDTPLANGPKELVCKPGEF